MEITMPMGNIDGQEWADAWMLDCWTAVPPVTTIIAGIRNLIYMNAREYYVFLLSTAVDSVSGSLEYTDVVVFVFAPTVWLIL